MTSRVSSSAAAFRHLLAALVVTSAGAVALQAQATTAPAQNVVAVPAVDAGNGLFSSSAAETSDTTTVTSLHAPAVDFAEAFQYGGGRRSGRPRYRGGNTNADGSAKYTFLAGVGLVQPIGNTYHYDTPSYGIQVGGGRQFNKNVALLAQFDYDNFGLTSGTLNNQSVIYFNATGQGLDGNAHVLSFTLDPTYTLFSGEGLGAYAVAGVGFYHKVTNFTVPAQGIGYDPYYGYYSYTANETIDHYSANAPGFNGGFGLTYKFSRFSNERLYGEVRYVYMLTSQRQGVTINNYTTAPATSTNFYPANSNRTSYIPVKFGLRF